MSYIYQGDTILLRLFEISKYQIQKGARITSFKSVNSEGKFSRLITGQRKQGIYNYCTALFADKCSLHDIYYVTGWGRYGDKDVLAVY